MALLDAVPPASAGWAAAADPWAGFAPAQVDIEQISDGGVVLRSPLPLAPYARCLTDLLAYWARIAPGRIFLAERGGGSEGQGWRKVTYEKAYWRVTAIAEALIERNLPADRPILVIAENGIDHALITLAALHIGLPVTPVSTAYARLGLDRLKYVLDFLKPALVYMDRPALYARALETLDFGGAEIVASEPLAGVVTTPFADLVATRPTEAVERTNAKIDGDTVAKILLTSGSTGNPKGVINTQRMLCSNQEAIRQIWPFLAEEPPTIVDWLPWSHTFGGNHNFGLVLRNGGTLYIDDGRPTPALIERTVANLRDVAPSIYFNVPRGYGALLDHLERDPDFNRHFFSRLKLVFYAAAALPQSLWERLEKLSRGATGTMVPMSSGWGMTETAPGMMTVHYPIDRAGVIGLPLPGSELKLKPSGDKLEMQVRGPNVTPGYWLAPEATESAFDDGWLKTGDAGRFAEPDKPAAGVVFDGRIGENFKLTSGTWVHVGQLRIGVVAAASPLLDDAVVTGHDRDEVGLLVFPNAAACRALCPDLPADGPLAEVLVHEAVREALGTAVARFNGANGGSSMTVTRLILLEEPPLLDANEITDKGYINQRAVLTRRAELVTRLYDHPAHPSIIHIAKA